MASCVLPALYASFAQLRCQCTWWSSSEPLLRNSSVCSGSAPCTRWIEQQLCRMAQLQLHMSVICCCSVAVWCLPFVCQAGSGCRSAQQLTAFPPSASAADGDRLKHCLAVYHCQTVQQPCARVAGQGGQSRRSRLHHDLGLCEPEGAAGGDCSVQWWHPAVLLPPLQCGSALLRWRQHTLMSVSSHIAVAPPPRALGGGSSACGNCISRL